jgi:hypothetical protein
MCALNISSTWMQLALPSYHPCLKERNWQWYLLSKGWRSLACAGHKILRGRRSKALLILQFVIRWRRVFSFILRSIYPWGKSYCTHSTKGCVGSRVGLEVLAKVPCREFNLSSSPESIHYSNHLLGCDIIDCLGLTNGIMWAISRKKWNGGPSSCLSTLSEDDIAGFISVKACCYWPIGHGVWL